MKKDSTPLLQQELQRAEVELAALRRQAEGVAAKINELEAVVVGLRYVLRRQGASIEKGPQNDWTRLSRPKAIERVLQSATEPMTPAAISRVLIGHGRSKDRPNGVSGALWRLRQAGKAEPMPEGQGWIWLGGKPPEEEEQEAPEATERLDQSA